MAAADASSRSQRIRESDLQGHFTHEEAKPDAADPGAELSSGASDSEETESGEGSVRVRTDVQVRRALEVLKSWTYFENLRGPTEPGEGTIIQATAQ